ncbi:hypothetical protein MKW98_019402 [Papaver atlanticum]|uniref:Uncharacterized protein n=1 Tax=Papaver atlanticum TaxID=357466 RepID=A0AAD4S968_9MAGN|nr:hypothetical protein MKW98_019402 [Papaver atlanticum]
MDEDERYDRTGIWIVHSSGQLCSSFQVSPILSDLYLVKRTYWFDIYKNIDKISLVSCPVLTIHLLTWEAILGIV